MWPLGLLAFLSQALAVPEHGRALVGLDYVPMGRGDLSWTAAEQGSGLLVGELDGVIRPPLTAWGGPRFGRAAVLGSLGLARQASTTWTGDLKTHRAVGAVRPGLDLRRYLGAPSQEGPAGYVQLGGYGSIPWVRYHSEAWSEEEALAMDEAETADRARIGGVGLRAGAGVEFWWPQGVAIGGRLFTVAHRQQATTTDGYTVDTWLQGEAALTISVSL